MGSSSWTESGKNRSPHDLQQPRWYVKSLHPSKLLSFWQAWVFRDTTMKQGVENHFPIPRTILYGSHNHTSTPTTTLPRLVGFHPECSLRHWQRGKDGASAGATESCSHSKRTCFICHFWKRLHASASSPSWSQGPSFWRREVLPRIIIEAASGREICHQRSKPCKPNLFFLKFTVQFSCSLALSYLCFQWWFRIWAERQGSIM